MKYRKKPIVIDAIQFIGDGYNIEEIANFFSGYKEHVSLYCGKIVIETLEGSMTANLGDWIIKGINGEYYPCKSDIFEKTYELVNMSSKLDVEVEDYYDHICSVIGFDAETQELRNAIRIFGKKRYEQGLLDYLVEKDMSED